MWHDEENGIIVAPEVMAHDSEGGFRVAEGPRDFTGRAIFHEKGAQRFILPLLRALGLEEEAAGFY
jgi:hypothetical protein